MAMFMKILPREILHSHIATPLNGIRLSGNSYIAEFDAWGAMYEESRGDVKEGM